jgi:DNA polymerase-3 subunit gamma/tau
MAYQVLARKWRPQRFDEVVGQRAITQTLRNAIKGERIAHAFVFAGPRGVGKTTTARILARALNCVDGPTSEPCGTCEPCVEIAEGRDIDVLEIDAATHTGIDNVREVIISGLSIPPVRDRYKIFVIDEVHQLSTPSFNALLKSIEEPPPHVAFVMATTELSKIPETILSRVQLFEFRAISTRAIGDQLKTIAQAEGIAIVDDAVALIARAAEGSLRDAETALDQVMAFAGKTISIDDVTTVLGLVGRDLLLDVLAAVADENGPAAFELTARAVEAGYDLKLVCRELSRVVRDLLVISVDPSRLGDPDIAPEGDRERLRELSGRFSREDLLRAFDVLTRAETDIKSSAEPRHHLEIGLLRWIQLRKLTPIVQLIDAMQRGGTMPPAAIGSGRESSKPPALPSSRRASEAAPPAAPAPATTAPAAPGESKTAEIRAMLDARRPSTRSVATGSGRPELVEGRQQVPQSNVRTPHPPLPTPQFKEQFLAEIQRSKAVFYGTVVAQAHRIDVDGDRVTFSFTPTQRAMRDQVEQNRAWVESVATKIAGSRIAVRTALIDAAPKGAAAGDEAEGARVPAAKAPDLKAVALGDAGVQALLDVFPADIREVEEME